MGFGKILKLTWLLVKYSLRYKRLKEIPILYISMEHAILRDSLRNKIELILCNLEVQLEQAIHKLREKLLA